eukprot:3529076-Amphidinium_carterae.1
MNRCSFQGEAAALALKLWDTMQADGVVPHAANYGPVIQADCLGLGSRPSILTATYHIATERLHT